MRLVDAALGHDAERRRPQPGREARRAYRARHGREAARELLVGFEPVADRALVAVVELDEFDRDLVACGDERIEVADEGVFADVVEEVVPGAPACLEGRAGAGPGAKSLRFGMRFEQRVRIGSERHTHRLEFDGFARIERALDALLDLDAHGVAVATQIDDGECDAALERAGAACRSPGAEHRHAVGLPTIPARSAGTSAVP